MKRIFRLSILSLIGIIISLTGKTQNKAGNSLLWKISKKGYKDTSYLFGTIHVICEQDYFWTGAMQKAFDQTNQLCLEMNISDPNLISDAGLMMLDLSGRTLRDYFTSEADYQLVSRFIEDSLGQSIQIAERMKPVALYMMYSVGLVKGPCKQTVSYELKLAEQGKANEVKIVGLETLSEQMEVLESIPTDSVIQQMIRIAKGVHTGEEELQDLIDAYKRQDLVSLNKLMAKAGSEGTLDGKLIIDNRNRKWIAPMTKMMGEQATFFAVGAGHIHGLLELLRADGYTVKAVK